MNQQSPTFAADNRPLFRDSDIEEMSWSFDLASYDEVRANAEAIYERLSDGSMPCDGPWPDERVSDVPSLDGRGDTRLTAPLVSRICLRIAAPGKCPTAASRQLADDEVV